MVQSCFEASGSRQLVIIDEAMKVIAAEAVAVLMWTFDLVDLLSLLH